MPFIFHKPVEKLEFVCEHPLVELMWFTAGLINNDASTVYMELHLLFKDKTKVSFTSNIGTEDCVVKAEKYLASVDDQDTQKLKSSNYWEQRAKAAEKYIESIHNTQIQRTDDQEHNYKKWNAVVELKPLIKPF